jgi:hypothetical protein
MSSLAKLIFGEGPSVQNTLHEANRKLDQIMSQLIALQAEVSRNTTVTTSALALIKGLKEKLDAAIGDDDALKALSAELAVNDQLLAAAVAENTIADAPPADEAIPESPAVRPPPSAESEATAA